jgi:hypothetical protein
MKAPALPYRRADPNMQLEAWQKMEAQKRAIKGDLQEADFFEQWFEFYVQVDDLLRRAEQAFENDLRRLDEHTVSVGSIFERSRESGTSVDAAGVSVDVVAMIGASAAWKTDPSNKSDADSGVAGLVGIFVSGGMFGGRWIVHLLEHAIDHFIRRLAEAHPESLS